MIDMLLPLKIFFMPDGGNKSVVVFCFFKYYTSNTNLLDIQWYICCWEKFGMQPPKKKTAENPHPHHHFSHPNSPTYRESKIYPPGKQQKINGKRRSPSQVNYTAKCSQRFFQKKNSACSLNVVHINPLNTTSGGTPQTARPIL